MTGRPDKIERGEERPRALVLHPVHPRSSAAGSASAQIGANGQSRSPEARLDEAVSLAEAIGLDVVCAETARINRRRPSTLLGTGTVEDLGARLAALEVDLVVVDGQLSPIQQRNLERAWSCKVIDRTALILEIFGARARTREGRLQVELAHLTYQRSRLVRTWTHLERQRGGFGFLGGPGERQLEIDRRIIGKRITRLKRDLETVRKRRALQRKGRKRVPNPVAALVGYTNAGKSTLFNRLTKSDILAADQLFATLDPTMRALTLDSGQVMILSDTVGFISDLPTDLVAAFRATLEEVIEADLILHVRDIAHPESAAQKVDVERVLGALGGTDNDGAWPDDRLIEVMNKADQLERDAKSALAERCQRENRPAVLISALSGEGCDDLLALIDARLSVGRQLVDYRLDPADGAAIAWLHDHGEVVDRKMAEDVLQIQVSLALRDKRRFEKRFRTKAAAPA